MRSSTGGTLLEGFANKLSQGCYEWVAARKHIRAAELLAKIGPNPRIIADDVWAKLVWAGLNLTAEDLPRRDPFRRKPLDSSYPVELCKALAVTWLFAGLRNNEILGLRLG